MVAMLNEPVTPGAALQAAPPDFDLRGRIIGPEGSNLDFIQSETEAVIILKGSCGDNVNPLHLSLSHANQDKLEEACLLAQNLLDSIFQDFVLWCTQNAPPSNQVAQNSQSQQQNPSFVANRMMSMPPPSMRPLSMPPPSMPPTSMPPPSMARPMMAPQMMMAPPMMSPQMMSPQMMPPQMMPPQMMPPQMMPPQMMPPPMMNPTMMLPPMMPPPMVPPPSMPPTFMPPTSMPPPSMPPPSMPPTSMPPTSMPPPTMPPTSIQSTQPSLNLPQMQPQVVQMVPQQQIFVAQDGTHYVKVTFANTSGSNASTMTMAGQQPNMTQQMNQYQPMPNMPVLQSNDGIAQTAALNSNNTSVTTPWQQNQFALSQQAQNMQLAGMMPYGCGPEPWNVPGLVPVPFPGVPPPVWLTDPASAPVQQLNTPWSNTTSQPGQQQPGQSKQDMLPGQQSTRSDGAPGGSDAGVRVSPFAARKRPATSGSGDKKKHLELREGVENEQTVHDGGKLLGEISPNLDDDGDDKNSERDKRRRQREDTTKNVHHSPAERRRRYLQFRSRESKDSVTSDDNANPKLSENGDQKSNEPPTENQAEANSWGTNTAAPVGSQPSTQQAPDTLYGQMPNHYQYYTGFDQYGQTQYYQNMLNNGLPGDVKQDQSSPMSNECKAGSGPTMYMVPGWAGMQQYGLSYAAPEQQPPWNRIIEAPLAAAQTPHSDRPWSHQPIDCDVQVPSPPPPPKISKHAWPVSH